MSKFFPEPILNLPKADIPIDGLIAYLTQGINHQILFMEFGKNAEIPEHSHEAQWGIILKGKIDLNMNGLTKTAQVTTCGSIFLTLVISVNLDKLTQY